MKEETQSKIHIYPSLLSGTLHAVPSKSHLHRVLICAAQGILQGAMNRIQIQCARAASEDVDVTLDCIRALGVAVSQKACLIELSKGIPQPLPLLPCKESGSSLRFLLPFAATKARAFTMTGIGRLPKRPMSEFASVLEKHGLQFEQQGTDFLPIHVTGALENGVFELPGDISSQYISGLLMALPALSGRSEIRLTTKLQSLPYIEMTLSVLALFGVHWQADFKRGVFSIEGPVTFAAPREIMPEGDWSSAAFWVCARHLGADITLFGVSQESTQGDRRVVEICKKLGTGEHIDVSDVPDLVPILAVTAANCTGRTVFTGTSRLRLKESDRVLAVTEMILNLGGAASARDDDITIEGIGGLRGGIVDSYKDHRIAMSAAIAGTFSKEGVTILNPFVTDKSYPGFYEDLKQIGGRLK